MARAAPSSPDHALHLAWALEYVQLGWRVHPCRPGDKKPILEDWPKRATTDPTLIERWWGRTPKANIAIATGPDSGVFVLDVDGPEGERALVELERHHGPLPDLYPMQWTGSGHGWQAFFTYPNGRTIRNSAQRLGPKLDARGDGGFVVVPPSLHPSGNLYQWAIDRSPGIIPPEPAPDWLVDQLDAPAPVAPDGVFDPYAYSNSGRSDRYGWRALESELALLATASEGRRNDQLNRSAHALYRLVADGRLHRSDVDDGLAAAARHVRLRDREISATLASAAKARGLR